MVSQHCHKTKHTPYWWWKEDVSFKIRRKSTVKEMQRKMKRKRETFWSCTLNLRVL